MRRGGQLVVVVEGEKGYEWGRHLLRMKKSELKVSGDHENSHHLPRWFSKENHPE